MFLRRDGNPTLARFELEKRDDSFVHELSGDGPADQQGKLGCADREILLDLYYVEFVFATFGLNGENVMRPLLIYANMNLIGLHLTHVWNGGAQVVLERIASNAAEYINQPVVSDLREKRLLVAESVLGDDSWSSVRNFHDRHAIVWENRRVLNQGKAVFAAPSGADDPNLLLAGERCNCVPQEGPELRRGSPRRTLRFRSGKRKPREA